MTCPESRSRLYPFLDGALPAEEERSVGSHLEVCPDCRRWFEETRALEKHVGRVLRSPAPPPGLAETIRRRLADDAPASPGRSIAKLVGLAAAAVLLVASIGAYLLLPAPGDPDGVSFASAGPSIVAFHRRQNEIPEADLEFPERSPARLEEQLTRALSFHCCVPDLSARGIEVRGGSTGRLDGPGSPAAAVGYVRYERDGVRIGHLDLLAGDLVLEDAYLERREGREGYVYQEGRFTLVALRIGTQLCLFVSDGLDREEAIAVAVAMLH